MSHDRHKPDPDPHADRARQDHDLPRYDHPVGGWGSLRGVGRMAKKTGLTATALKILATQNKPRGMMCTSCAWAKPADPHLFEFCENGAKATLWELDERRADPAFWAAHTLTELREWHDHDLELAGRLTHPLRYDAASDRYFPVSWGEAVADIAGDLRAMDPKEAVFYSSGHAGLEAAFLYGLFARAMGHQNLPQSSNMCHETTSVNLLNFIGTPVGTCTLEDFDHCDLILFFGQNTGTSSPRFLHVLKDVVTRGGRIMTFNPLRERGLIEFVDPQNPVQMTVGRATPISEQYYQLRPGGDVAVLTGIIKHVLAAEEAAPGTVLDHDFIAEHTAGFEDMAQAVRQADWAQIESHSGLTRAMIEEAAEAVLAARNVICIYGMGLTQHVNGWLNLGMLCNLLLMRGQIGRLGAGISPVRGHSNVQGQRTVGIGGKSSHFPGDKLRVLFGIEPPEEDGMEAVAACEALLEGRVKAMITLGGNLVRALPDRARIEKAWPTLPLTVSIATKPNRSHLIPGQKSYLLPCLGRTDTDIQASGPQAVTMEDSLSHIYGSLGQAEPPGPEVLSEVAIVAMLAKATLPPHPKRPWDDWTADYALIRDRIAATFPDDFADFNARMFAPGGFYRGNSARAREWNTDNGKANFTTPDGLTALGEALWDDSVLTLITLRSNDQFNTTIYGFSDRLRGLEGSRDILLINPDEMLRLGLARDQRVAVVCAVDDGQERIVPDLKVVPYDLPDRCVAGYYPELNPLVPLGRYERHSQTPAYKGTPVRILA